jgi:hypothetical protein
MLYALSRRAGRGLIYRYGRFIHITPTRLDQAERWVQRHGPLAVIAGRLIPGLRIATGIGCGVLEVPLRVYVPSMALGALLYLLFYTLLGYAAGPAALAVVERVHLPAGVLGPLAALGVLCFWLARARRALVQEQGLAVPVEAGVPRGRAARVAGERSLGAPSTSLPRLTVLRAQAGLLGGGLATLAGVLLTDVVARVASSPALGTARPVSRAVARLQITLARQGQPLLLVAALGLWLSSGLLLGALYGLGAHRLGGLRRDWIKGLAYWPLVLGATLLVLTAPLDAGVTLPPPAAEALDIGLGLYALTYALVLALSFPIFVTTRRPVRRWPWQRPPPAAGQPLEAAVQRAPHASQPGAHAAPVVAPHR